NDLLLKIDGTSDQITITNAYTYPTGASSAQGIERIEFADGTVTARNGDRQRVDMFHRKRILTRHWAGYYRSSFMPNSRNIVANTEWRIAA
ncbi:MAG: calcium-binding protein, partial [Georgfuchsia sp.]